MTALGLLPTVREQVRPWFDRYGATLDDAPSFRHMIDMANRDRDALEALIPDYEAAGLADVVADARADISAADELIAAMCARLAAILGDDDHVD